jgi:hypothetical protein
MVPLCIYVIGVVWNPSGVRLSSPISLLLFCSCRMLALLCLKDRTTVEVEWYAPLVSIGLLHCGCTGKGMDGRNG